MTARRAKGEGSKDFDELAKRIKERWSGETLAAYQATVESIRRGLDQAGRGEVSRRDDFLKDVSLDADEDETKS